MKDQIPKRSLTDMTDEIIHDIDEALEHDTKLTALRDLTDLVAYEVGSERMTFAEGHEAIELFTKWIETGTSVEDVWNGVPPDVINPPDIYG